MRDILVLGKSLYFACVWKLNAKMSLCKEKRITGHKPEYYTLMIN